jgi:hypothetical protein
VIIKIVPPWTDQQVANLNAYQRSGRFHPFTCGNDRTDENHLDGEGLLVARSDGWHCLYCNYKQTWAHNFMAEKLI